MSAISEILKNNWGQCGVTEWPRLVRQPMKLREAAEKAGISYADAMESIITDPEVDYFPSVDVVLYRPLPPRKFSREEMKISKSDQP